MATLKDAKIGQTVRVKKLTGEGAVKRRIMDMGITKGVEVYIRKVAPLGDPIENKHRTDPLCMLWKKIRESVLHRRIHIFILRRNYFFSHKLVIAN